MIRSGTVASWGVGRASLGAWPPSGVVATKGTAPDGMYAGVPARRVKDLG